MGAACSIDLCTTDLEPANDSVPYEHLGDDHSVSRATTMTLARTGTDAPTASMCSDADVFTERSDGSTVQAGTAPGADAPRPPLRHETHPSAARTPACSSTRWCSSPPKELRDL